MVKIQISQKIVNIQFSNRTRMKINKNKVEWNRMKKKQKLKLKFKNLKIGFTVEAILNKKCYVKAIFMVFATYIHNYKQTHRKVLNG